MQSIFHAGHRGAHPPDCSGRLHLPARLLGVLVLLTSTGSVVARDVWEHVPDEALGCLIVNDLTRFDAHAQRLSRALGIALPGPLALLKATTGIGPGVDERGSAMIVLMPKPAGSLATPVCVFLPVEDHHTFVETFGGDSRRRVAALRLAGEEVLATRIDSWTVLADRDGRPWLEQLHTSNGLSPAPLGETWRQWMTRQDAVAVALPGGSREFWKRVAPPQSTDEQTLFDNRELEDEFHDDLLESDLELAAAESPGLASWRILEGRLRDLFSRHADLFALVTQTERLGLGLQVTDADEAILSLRVGWREGSQLASITNSNGVAARPLGRLPSGPFLLAAGGSLPPAWWQILAGPYLRISLETLEGFGSTPYPKKNVVRLRAAVANVFAQISEVGLLARPTNTADGVFSNRFALLSTPSASTLRDTILQTVQEWNWLMDNSDGDVVLHFESTQVDIGQRRGTEFAASMATAVGAENVPEVEQAMERLFGDGGKLRFQLVTIDETTLLLANASPSQVAQLLVDSAEQSQRLTDTESLQEIHRLFRTTPRVECFINPHDYTNWLLQRAEAEVGDVVGGPLVRVLPPGRPVGLSLDFASGELHAELVATAETIRHLTLFFPRR